MYIKADTLDDLLQRVFSQLLKSKNRTNPTKGDAREEIGVILELAKPKYRLSQTETRGRLFSCLGELLWYLAKTDDLSFIKYYLNGYDEFSDDGTTVYGAYGPRLFDMRGVDQVSNICDRLRTSPDSRKAVIQLFNAEDIVNHYKDVPCTCTLQFMIRKSHLHMFTSMRSNDAFLGLPHDIFSFTMLQEIIARTLSVGLGRYKHAIGSLHLYEKDVPAAHKYISEGWQTRIGMPSMPKGDPWPSISIVLKAESCIRKGSKIDALSLGLNDYWADLVRLLQIYALTKERTSRREIVILKNSMSSPIYDQYIRRKEPKTSLLRESKQIPLIEI